MKLRNALIVVTLVVATVVCGALAWAVAEMIRGMAPTECSSMPDVPRDPVGTLTAKPRSWYWCKRVGDYA